MDLPFESLICLVESRAFKDTLCFEKENLLEDRSILDKIMVVLFKDKCL